MHVTDATHWHLCFGSTETSAEVHGYMRAIDMGGNPEALLSYTTMGTRSISISTLVFDASGTCSISVIALGRLESYEYCVSRSRKISNETNTYVESMMETCSFFWVRILARKENVRHVQQATFKSSGFNMSAVTSNNATRTIGQVKWFGSDKNGDRRKSYGFINVISGNLKNDDIFVHQSAIRPCHSTYRTLQKGEFVEFDVVTMEDGRKHADNVTGLFGYPMMCDMYYVTQHHLQQQEQHQQE